MDDLKDEVNRLHERLGQMETILKQMQKVIESFPIDTMSSRTRSSDHLITKGLIE